MQDDDNQTRGDRATQPMDAGWLSFAVDPFKKYDFIDLVGLSFQTSSQSPSPQFRSVLEKKKVISAAASAPRVHSFLSVIHFDAPFISDHSVGLQNCHSFHRIVFTPKYLIGIVFNHKC